jgi:hypothetical protein
LSTKREAVTVTPPEADKVPVATEPKVLALVQYGSCPVVGLVDVLSPPNVSVPVVVMGPPKIGKVVLICVTVPEVAPHGLPIVVRSPPAAACTQLPFVSVDAESAVVEA